MGQSWWPMLLLFLSAIVYSIDKGIVGVLAEPIRRDFAIGDTEMGLLLGLAYSLLSGILGLGLGHLVDRSHRFRLLAGCILLWSVATIACGLARGFGDFFVFRMLVGLGEAALAPAAVSLIADMFAPGQRGKALSAYLIGASIGSGLSSIIPGWLATHDLGVLVAERLAQRLRGLRRAGHSARRAAGFQCRAAAARAGERNGRSLGHSGKAGAAMGDAAAGRAAVWRLLPVLCRADRDHRLDGGVHRAALWAGAAAVRAEPWPDAAGLGHGRLSAQRADCRPALRPPPRRQAAHSGAAAAAGTAERLCPVRAGFGRWRWWRLPRSARRCQRSTSR